MRPAQESRRRDGRRRSPGPAVDVIELQLARGAAHAPALERPRAAPAIALPDRAPDRGRDVARPPRWRTRRSCRGRCRVGGERCRVRGGRRRVGGERCRVGGGRCLVRGGRCRVGGERCRAGGARFRVRRGHRSGAGARGAAVRSGRGVARRRRGRRSGLRPRLRPDTAALPVPLEDEVEGDLEDVGVAGVRVRVRERIARRRELVEEPPGDGDVDPAELGGLRLDDGRRREDGGRGEGESRSLLGRSFAFGTHLVGQPTGRLRTRERRRDDGGVNRGDDRSRRRRLRRELGDDVLRVSPGRTEEPRKNVGGVLLRDHLGELEHGRDAQAPVPDRLQDLREALDQLDRGLPVRGGAVREPEALHEEREQRGVSEVGPRALAIEGCERGEELGEGVALAAQEVGEGGRQLACGAHGAILSRGLAASGDARGSPLARDRAGAARAPPASGERGGGRRRLV